MIGYIYQIINKANGKRYIGKTNDIERRLGRHFTELKGGYHHSIKLQRAYDKYGKDNFSVTYEIFTDITEEELAKKEMDYIMEYDSYENGYNETLGGEGHSTLFDFKTSVLIYQIGQRYAEIQHMLARYYHCDKSTIASITKRDYLGNIEYDENELNDLIKSIGIPDEKLIGVFHRNERLTNEQVFQALAGVELEKYNQASCAGALGVEKDVVQKILAGKTYKTAKALYDKMSKEEKEDWLAIFKSTTDILERAKKDKRISQVKISQNIVDFILDNKDNFTQIDLAKTLGIDRKRVSRIIKKETYCDLVNDWEKRHSS